MSSKKLIGFSSYDVYEDGRIYSSKRKMFMVGGINNSGYRQVRLTDDNGKTWTLGIHRVVCLTFNELPVTSELVTNHIDGDKLNNHISNLEMVTYQENTWHAGVNGLTSKCIPMYLIKYSDQDKIRFNSILECSEFLGVSVDLVNYRLVNGEGRVYPDGYIYSYTGELKEVTTDKFGRSVPCMSLDIDTDIETHYEKLTDLSEALDIPLSTIYVSLESGKQPFVKDKFIIKYDDGTPWRKKYPRIIERLIGNNGKPLVVYNDNGEPMFFKSGAECSRVLGIKPTTLNYRLKTNKNYRYLEDILEGLHI